MKRIIFILSAVLAMAALLAGCSGNSVETPAPTAEAVYMPTRSSDDVVWVAPVSDCENLMSFLGDVNYPDGTVVEAGKTFIKDWEVQNLGTCTWDSGYKLRFISGEQMTADDAIELPEVAPGEKGKISIEFTAPKTAGTYRSEWKLFGSDNRFFGETIYVEIVVE